MRKDEFSGSIFTVFPLYAIGKAITDKTCMSGMPVK